MKLDNFCSNFTINFNEIFLLIFVKLDESDVDIIHNERIFGGKYQRDKKKIFK